MIPLAFKLPFELILWRNRLKARNQSLPRSQMSIQLLSFNYYGKSYLDNLACVLKRIMNPTNFNDQLYDDITYN